MAPSEIGRACVPSWHDRDRLMLPVRVMDRQSQVRDLRPECPGEVAHVVLDQGGDVDRFGGS